MLPYARHIPALICLLIVLALHVVMWRWLRARASRAERWAGSLALAALATLLVFGFSLGSQRVDRALPAGDWLAWVNAAALIWALLFTAFFIAVVLWRRAAEFDPGRRRLLQAAGGAVLGAPAAVLGFGAFVERTRISAREVDLPIDGLPPALDGLRLSQLTDIHLGPFLSEVELARAVGLANEFRAHIALVTGDLITDRGDPVDACLRRLAALRASHGIFGCLGNHEGYTKTEAYVKREGRRRGMDFLRSESRQLHFGDASLNIAGVDYQPMGGPYLRQGKELLQEGCFNILLSHNPDVFPVAVRQGYDLTISGHTHGGQLNLEIGELSLNVSRLFTSYIHGLYRQGRSALYVSRGIGTVGIPVRVGAPPEVTLLRLRAG